MNTEAIYKEALERIVCLAKAKGGTLRLAGGIANKALEKGARRLFPAIRMTEDVGRIFQGDLLEYNHGEEVRMARVELIDGAFLHMDNSDMVMYSDVLKREVSE